MNINLKEKIDLKELNLIIEKLTEILLKENNYLRKMELEKLEEFSEEKLALTFLMTKIKKIFQNDELDREDFLQKDKEKIKEKYKILEDLAKENLTLTEYVMSANRKILDSLNKYYLGKLGEVVTYNNKGKKIKDR